MWGQGGGRLQAGDSLTVQQQGAPGVKTKVKVSCGAGEGAGHNWTISNSFFYSSRDTRPCLWLYLVPRKGHKIERHGEIKKCTEEDRLRDTEKERQERSSREIKEKAERKAESLPAKFRNKTRMPALTTSISPNVGSASHSNQTGEISQTEKDKYCMMSLICGI